MNNLLAWYPWIGLEVIDGNLTLTRQSFEVIQEAISYRTADMVFNHPINEK